MIYIFKFSQISIYRYAIKLNSPIKVSGLLRLSLLVGLLGKKCIDSFEIKKV